MKRTLPVIFAFALVIFIFIFMLKQDKSYNSAAHAVEKVFSETGAAAVSSEIYVRGTSRGRVLGESDVDSLLEDIVNRLGAGYSKDIQVFNTIENDYAEGVEINYIIDENKTIQLSMSNETDKDDVTNLTISLLDTSRNPSVRSNAAAVADCLEKHGIDFETNISLTGSIDGKMGKDEIEDLYIRAFGSIGADSVEGIEDNGLVSVSAFSPSIGRAVIANSKRVNINMAARYNSYENKTYIWLAAPVITTEY